MLRKFMIIPNVLLLACAIFIFHRVFLAGHITGRGSLMVFSAALPLVYGITGKMPDLLKAAAALLNLVLLLMAGYIFWGTAYIMSKAGMLGWEFYVTLGIMWAATLCGAYFLRKNNKQSLGAGIFFNGILGVVGALGLYCYAFARWAPWMTALLLGTILLVAVLNVYFLAFSIKWRKICPVKK